MIFYFGGINAHAMCSEDVLPYFKGGVLFECSLKFIYHLVWDSFFYSFYYWLVVLYVITLLSLSICLLKTNIFRSKRPMHLFPNY